MRADAYRCPSRRASQAGGLPDPGTLVHGAPVVRAPLALSRYQWLVLVAAWLGWGFDVFDGLLFNYVAPVCVPDLLHLAPGDPSARAQTTFWNAALTSMLLIGWGTGGLVFGRLTDRLGRTRTLLITMMTYSVATAACALAPNLWVLGAFRFVASLGIGGEWAAGAALVAETVPEAGRAWAGTLMYTSSPLGLFLATFICDVFFRQWGAVAANPSLAWRLVFLAGLLPAAAAIAIRWRVREPEHWQNRGGEPALPRIRELWQPSLRRRTAGGLAMAVIALVTWWTCNAFTPMLAHFLADDVAPRPPPAALALLRAQFQTTATTIFNLGGLLGALLTAPLAMRFGRRPMFVVYFLISGVGIWLAYGLPLAPQMRLYAIGLIGVTVFGVFGSFTFYLPELFPTRLRGTGAGFCYNAGRYVTAAFPFLVAVIALKGIEPTRILRWVAVVPLAGIALMWLGLGEETRGQTLASGDVTTGSTGT